MARVLSMVVIALSGPLVDSLVCDWTCKAEHQQTPAVHGCHGSDASAPGPTWTGGHQCHERVAPELSILSSTPHAASRVVAVAAALPVETRSSALPLSAVRSSGPPHAPPPLLIPLRI